MFRFLLILLLSCFVVSIHGQFTDQNSLDKGIADGFLFPGSVAHNTKRPPNGQTTGATPTTEDPSVERCILKCPATMEYSPICGTDGVRYDNMGRLLCAQNCGRAVAFLQNAPCPVAN